MLHAGRQALYVRCGALVTGITTSSAVHVTSAIATGLDELPVVETGAPAEVRDGVLLVAGLAVSVVRLVPTTLPSVPATAATRLAPVDGLPALARVREQLPGVALDALSRGDRSAVIRLLGLGDGLTPVGDDVLCGWLVTSLAAGCDTTAVRVAVQEHAHRTTDLSATLLADAAEGHSIPEFRSLLLALASDRGVDAAVARLLTVGHSSGAGLLLGAHLALSSTPPFIPSTEGTRR